MTFAPQKVYTVVMNFGNNAEAHPHATPEGAIKHAQFIVRMKLPDGVEPVEKFNHGAALYHCQIKKNHSIWVQADWVNPDLNSNETLTK